jgi:hypothetical protein
MIKAICTNTDAENHAKPLLGKSISHVWRGHGSAIFLEIGALTSNNNGRHPKGEFTIGIEWSWRLENNNTIVLGSWSDDDIINKIKILLKDQVINKVSFFSRLKEIEIQTKDNYWLLSFATAEGDPEWSLRNNNKWLFCKKGKFVIEENT